MIGETKVAGRVLSDVSVQNIFSKTPEEKFCNPVCDSWEAAVVISICDKVGKGYCSHLGIVRTDCANFDPM